MCHERCTLYTDDNSPAFIGLRPASLGGTRERGQAPVKSGRG